MGSIIVLVFKMIFFNYINTALVTKKLHKYFFIVVVNTIFCHVSL